MTDISTDGGSYIEGSAHSGGDWIGRDRISYELPPSDSDLLKDIHDLLLGNSRKGRDKGLIHIVNEMRQDIENLYHFTWGLIIALVVVLAMVIYLLIIST